MPKKPQKKPQQKSNPSLPQAAVPWVEPFPEAVMKDDKGRLTDTVMVRAVPTQDIRVNGHLLKAGVETVLPCSIAHAHANALSGPIEKE